jgi:hypothetical protein
VEQDPVDVELIKAHLKRWEENLPCPICKTDAWEVGGPIGYSVSDQVEPKAGEILRKPLTFPLAIMICSTCGYLRQFAWAKVRQSVNTRG